MGRPGGRHRQPASGLDLAHLYSADVNQAVHCACALSRADRWILTPDATSDVPRCPAGSFNTDSLISVNPDRVPLIKLLWQAELCGSRRNAANLQRGSRGKKDVVRDLWSWWAQLPGVLLVSTGGYRLIAARSLRVSRRSADRRVTTDDHALSCHYHGRPWLKQWSGCPVRTWLRLSVCF